ncbi:uncharacterized protein LOC135829439 [Sycon ciliatum]|uniref:uncharacterized protein LOC135829439 n=1 Tax=Sycon ciliatum TaxID=27933 RepID=UPI0031F6614E
MSFLAVSALLLLLSVASRAESARESPESAEHALPRADSVESVESVESDVTVWLLKYNYTQYVYSELTTHVLALRPGGKYVDDLDVDKRRVSFTYKLPLPAFNMAIGHLGRLVVLMHTAKMTTLDLSRRQLSTRDFPFPNVTMGVHGLAVDLTSEHTTCAWLAYSDNNTYQNAIVCADDVHDTPLVCSNPGIGSLIVSYAIWKDDGSIYELTPLGYIVKHRISSRIPSPFIPRCAEYVRTKYMNYGAFYAPSRAWLSYDQTRIFLSNGLTVATSSDLNIDLQIGRALNGTWESLFIHWMDQEKKDPYHEILAMQRIPDPSSWQQWRLVINRFSWPYLRAEAEPVSIPTPTNLGINPFAFGGQIHFHGGPKAAIAIVNYSDSNGLYTPGIAYIKL